MTRKTNFKWFTNKTRKHLTVKAKKYLSNKAKSYYREKKRLQEREEEKPKTYLVRVWAKLKDYGKGGHKIFIEAFAEESTQEVNKKEQQLKDLLYEKVGDRFGFQIIEKLVFGAEREEIVFFSQPLKVVIMYKYSEGGKWKRAL